ncbi:MAG TPA: hypothetical protein VFA15_03970, partial [Nitrososphaera sp.]|nr:hypothetical protein [Nitrososphaera sp.]
MQTVVQNGVFTRHLNLGFNNQLQSGIYARIDKKVEEQDVSRLSGEIFEDIKFIRLAAWRECRRSTVLDGDTACGGQIYRRFKLKANRDVIMEFWSSGTPIDSLTSRRLDDLLLQDGKVKLQSLVGVADGLGLLEQRIAQAVAPDSDRLRFDAPVCLDDAEIGEVHGRRMLA